MNFLNSLFSQETMKALGWTLVHSVWQIALISILLAILMLVVQRSSNLRYILSISALPMILCSAVVTFFLSYEVGRNTSAERKDFKKAAVSQISASLEQVDAEEVQPAEAVSFTQQFRVYFDRHFPLLITLWFLGILVLTLRFLGSLAYTQRLKRYKVTDITHQWEGTIEVLSKKMGLNRSVRLLESAMITVPMVVGYIKPVILLPVGTLTGLSVSQLESILAHELAHIYRKDYLVNILQTLVEIIFFYHPGIWWIAARIREERENCCDDIVVNVNENSLVYAKALTTLGEMRHNSPQLALAATGSKGVLFKRIKRLLTQPKESPTFSEGFFTACILVICVFSITFIAKASLTSSDKPTNQFSSVMSMQEGEVSAVVMDLADTSGKNNNLVIIKNKKGKIIDLYVNGKKIAKNKVKDYQEMIDKTLAQQEQKGTRKSTLSEDDQIAMNNMLEELEEVDNTDEENRSRHTAHSHKRAEDARIRSQKLKESSRMMEDFTQDAMEIAKRGMEIGQLSIELESLQKRLNEPGGDLKLKKSEVQKIENQIKALEREMEKLGEEMEISGEMMGVWGIEVAKEALENIDIKFEKEEKKERRHHEERHEDHDFDFHHNEEHEAHEK